MDDLECLAAFFDEENRRDWETYRAFPRPEVEWALRRPDGRVELIRGPEEYMARIQAAYAGWDGRFRCEPASPFHGLCFGYIWRDRGMTEQSKKILAEMQVRKSKKQKENFRAWLCGELKAAGYAPAVEKGFASQNVVAGDPDRAKVLLTAHYDTQAVLPVPNFITPRNPVFFVLYQVLIVLPLFIAVGVAEGLIFAFVPEPVAWWLAPLACLALCIFFIWWVMDGRANRHTANDNTSGVVLLLETALALPPEHRGRVCFVFFDNEEKGMFGSAAFAKKHRDVKKNTVVLNFDCVGDGDSIQFFPQGKLKKDGAALGRLEAAFRPAGGKDVQVVRGFSMYPSDNANFKKGAGVCALKHKKVIGYYMDRIHTSRDTVLEEANIALLRDGALRYIAALD